jgi:hypothetical protein
MRLVGFGLVWAALALYTAEGALNRRRERRPLDQAIQAVR